MQKTVAKIFGQWKSGSTRKLVINEPGQRRLFVVHLCCLLLLLLLLLPSIEPLLHWTSFWNEKTKFEQKSQRKNGQIRTEIHKQTWSWCREQIFWIAWLCYAEIKLSDWMFQVMCFNSECYYSKNLLWHSYAEINSFIECSKSCDFL